MNLTNYGKNKLIDALIRGQSLGAPATLYFGLITSTKGARANSTAYSLNDTITVLADDGIIHLYKCTTAGTSNSTQPTTYDGVANEVITDGTAVFTEQDSALDAGTAFVEVSGGSYARVAVTSNLTNFSATQGGTSASSGTSGETSNLAAITFPAPTAQWHPTGGNIWGVVIYDASSSGNPWIWHPLEAVKNINNGDTAPSFAIGEEVISVK